MTTLKAAPKWQKSLKEGTDRYHDYTDSNDYQGRNSRDNRSNSRRDDRRSEAPTNKVWGSAKTSNSTYHSEKQARFKREDGEFSRNSRDQRDDRSTRGKSFSDNKFSKGPKRDGFKRRDAAPKAKPRVFGPNGVKSDVQ